MKFLAVTILALAAVVSARNLDLEDVLNFEASTAYGYLTKIGVPLADKIRKAEEEASQNPSRIIDGSLAVLGQFPYQAGLLLLLPSGSVSFGGGVLVSTTRVLTAAHNLFDGVSTVTNVTVVLGSVTVFTGGTRLTTSDMILHEDYSLRCISNDIAMIILPSAASISHILAPIALPSGSQLNEDFADNIAIASGFGKTADIGGVVANQPLSFVDLLVITNAECANTFGSCVQPSNVCTRGAGSKNICTGDSGGPLAVVRNNSPLLIGITSFASSSGCEIGQPAGFTRVSYYISWINNLL